MKTYRVCELMHCSGDMQQKTPCIIFVIHFFYLFAKNKMIIAPSFFSKRAQLPDNHKYVAFLTIVFCKMFSDIVSCVISCS